eukprot:CAMPEP_0177379882 /NCGR_PEP_ID=MMETSP0368-20130122/47191_1 /TAXON_ID=447022 ORGANISM="Scrippsiella hangoei-like, Strain SHHI-4" /NCGR_SAMPLE_ID=MMETSP0368 /ASSEMBLY_ACC=CAM_ASM_000363 /LENGTH=92 /DNA_ID=CAMNT_0018844101 /DNA_START=10 /DNA_END=284 /DNA_ORIENTATION=-
MFVGKVVKKKFATRLKVISENACENVMRFTNRRLTTGSVTAERMAATVAAVAPWMAAPPTLVIKLEGSSFPPFTIASPGEKLGNICMTQMSP